MNRYILRRAAVLLFQGALILTPAARAQAGDDVGTPANKELLAKVSKRLLDACDRDPVPGWAWPPDVQFEDKGKIDAYAALKSDEKPPQPIVRLDVLLMEKVVQGDPDRLALVLGHELSHILLRHVGKDRGNTELLRASFTRDQELAADHSGMDLMLKAGYLPRKGKKAFERFKDLKLDYSSFEGLGQDHPSWDDRLALIDEPNSTAWKSMSAFDDGVFFLTTEQYPLAEQCFDRVAKEFPGCYEAQVNLGFACLMEYCDKLDADDLRDYGIGQLLIDGFYRRAVSIPIRGRDPKLWRKAVDALREALRLKDDLTLAKADLGLAYLVHPDGKDVGEAARWLQEAADAAAADKTLDPMAHAALLVNLGVADLAAGNADKGLAHLEQGERVGLAAAGRDHPGRGENSALKAAVLYNRALRLAVSKDKDSREMALKLFEEYLTTAGPLSLWRPLAYDRYASLCKDLDHPAKDKDAFTQARAEPFRLLASVKLKSGKEVSLGQDVPEVVKKLGAGREIVGASGTNIKAVIYDQEGVKLLVTDKVVAICLIGAEAPELPLRPRGTGSEKAADVHVGMTQAELESVLPEQPEAVHVTDQEVDYRYYRDLGMAALVKEGRVVTLVVAQIPRERE